MTMNRRFFLGASRQHIGDHGGHVAQPGFRPKGARDRFGAKPGLSQRE